MRHPLHLGLWDEEAMIGVSMCKEYMKMLLRMYTKNSTQHINVEFFKQALKGTANV